MWVLFITYLTCDDVHNNKKGGEELCHLLALDSPNFSFSCANTNNQNNIAKGRGNMLALLVSIGSIEMNHRHKPQKEFNSKRFKRKTYEKDFYLLGKMSNFFLENSWILESFYLEARVYTFWKRPKRSFSWFYMKKGFLWCKRHKECSNFKKVNFGK